MTDFLWINKIALIITETFCFLTLLISQILQLFLWTRFQSSTTICSSEHLIEGKMTGGPKKFWVHPCSHPIGLETWKKDQTSSANSDAIWAAFLRKVLNLIISENSDQSSSSAKVLCQKTPPHLIKLSDMEKVSNSLAVLAEKSRKKT